MCKDFANKKIVLFGCGEIGYKVLQMLGSDNVACFCDNNQNLQGTLKWGKNVISLEQLKEKYDKVIVIICVRITKAFQIAYQLDEKKIYDYWIYPMVEINAEKKSSSELISFFCDENEMRTMKAESYWNKISELQKQLNYMKRHYDIKLIKPATSMLRKRQLAYVDFGNFICRALESIGVKPFLCGGNLLGYIRNNGFIPWDDDMDFQLIREEYERLYRYCLTQQDADGYVLFKYDGRIERIQFIGRYSLFKLAKEQPGEQNLELDFFSLDYYADDYPFEIFRKEAHRIHAGAYEVECEKDKLKYVRKEMENNDFIVKKSNTIFYGFDNQESIRVYNKGKMMSEDVVFPLRKAEFEGKQFWIPNNPEEFLSYTYENIWELPDDIGLQKHV